MISKAHLIAARKKINLLGVIACESRYLILVLIQSHKKLTVQNIAEELDMTHSAVSHQLSILAKTGILTCSREGREAFYRVTNSPASTTIMRIIKA